MTPTKKWNVYLDGRVVGPCSVEELAKLEGFGPDHKVALQNGGGRWLRARAVAELGHLFPQKPHESGEETTIDCSECGARFPIRESARQVQCAFCNSWLNLAEGDMALWVATDCPSCGAAVEFPESDNSFRCRFCGTRLLVPEQRRMLRYHVRPSLDADGAKRAARQFFTAAGQIGSFVGEPWLYYYPAWRYTCSMMGIAVGQRLERTITERQTSAWDRFSDTFLDDRPGFGASFAARAGEMEVHEEIRAFRDVGGKGIDEMIPASDVEIGFSPPGVRTSVLRLLPYNEEELSALGRIGAPSVPPQDMIECLLSEVDLYSQRRALAGIEVPEPDEEHILLEYRCLLGEKLSLVYFPFWIVELCINAGCHMAVIDGLTREVTRVLEEHPSCAANEIEIDIGGATVCVPLKCPFCNQTLPVGAYDRLFPCTGCGRLWRAGESGLLPMEFLTVPPRQESTGPALQMPVWCFEAVLAADDRRIATRGELAQLIPRMRSMALMRRDDADRPIVVYVQAWGDRRWPHISRLTSALTERQLVLSAQNGRVADLVRCIHAEEEARELAHLQVLSMIPTETATSQKWLGFLEEARLDIKSSTLLVLPASDLGAEVRDRVIGLTVPKGELEDELRVRR